MLKQLNTILWAFIYGEVAGYIAGALSGAEFNWVTSGIICGVVGIVAINILDHFVGSNR
ncbi:hypothetical protein FC40_GL000705 [Ligilactobacillus hayakitensis DSM 18933 = JCM 14209]|uniref:DUF2929 domain-containing protein n=1 Tax=Ligilactobacillus hayakitensis DSM 18933 = JCM 14209 TaxID=1423755 RepID=A0A0R1WRW5_9LACO|nr:YjzD family protein [Ligilactobacillus hayakitensis]KRM18916.1 hypothetical protein FC40_GL000705 [Ligilactobacillus hayakitensis DSM 18933 = JCM 14209]